MTNKPEYIIIHHSATKDTDGSDFAAIKKYHTQTKGWSDIGYHWVLEKVAGVYGWKVGRAESKKGAHCSAGNMNNKSIGLCLVGNYEEEIPTAEAYALLAAKCKEVMERYPAIKDTSRILLHGQVGATSCPGKNFSLKKLLAALTNLVSESQTATEIQAEDQNVESAKEDKVEEATTKKIEVQYPDDSTKKIESINLAGNNYCKLREILPPLGFDVDYQNGVVLIKPNK